MLARPAGPLAVVVLANLVVAALVGVVLLGAEPAVTAASQDPPQEQQGSLSRTGGTDPYAAAVETARASFPSGPVRVVFVVTATDTTDAMTAGAAAAVLGGPVLPVGEDGIPAPVRRELRRLDPGRIIVLGGADAVTDATVAQLAAFTDGTVTRLAGTDRFETAAAAATTLFTAPVPQVLVVIDPGAALETAPPVASRVIRPVLLTTPGAVPSPTAAALRALRPRSIVVLGDPSVTLLAELRETTTGPVTTLREGA